MRCWRLVTVVLLLAACSGPPATAVVNPPTANVPATFASLQTRVAATDESALPTSGPQTTSTPEATAGPGSAATPAAGLLTVTVTSPADNAVVTTPQVDIWGQSAPNAVVTLNDEITIADATGVFSATVSLVDGPNVIEVVASDAFGNEADLQLTVTYDSGI